MRTIAKAAAGLVFFIWLMTVPALCSFAESRVIPIDSAARDKSGEVVVIDGYSGSGANTGIINIGNCNIADRINNEDGRIAIVKEVETD